MGHLRSVSKCDVHKKGRWVQSVAFLTEKNSVSKSQEVREKENGKSLRNILGIHGTRGNRNVVAKNTCIMCYSVGWSIGLGSAQALFHWGSCSCAL